VQDVDVNRSLEDTLSELSYKLDGVTVDKDFAPDLPSIAAYGGELNQAWTTLIDNAADAVGDGGRIRLTTTCERDRVLVQVSNDGPGIPEALKGRSFEPFYTTKDVGTGTGLGLDVSYGIVVGRRGGGINVVTRPGETRVEVRLPVEGPVDGGAAPTDAGRSVGTSE
jgi:signal transduction histidine kinase